MFEYNAGGTYTQSTERLRKAQVKENISIRTLELGGMTSVHKTKCERSGDCHPSFSGRK
jgi:hypothetical protein